jgi:RnfABCDGE-type electron transport complex C subunit
MKNRRSWMSDNLIDIIKESGIVGAGGAGFPTHVKLKAKCEYLIVNAAECEPLIRVDQLLLMFHAKEFLEGLSLIIKEIGAKKSYIAIKGKHKEVVEKLKSEINGYDNIELFLLDDFYPAGDEQITVYEVLKKVVPQGGIPLNVGCIVCNVETVLNVFNATQGIPVTSKYVTITGDVEKPLTYKLPIGMSYREALKLCGAKNLDNKAIIDGGPMMGKLISDVDMPITKTTKAIIILDKEHYVIKKKLMDMSQILKQSKTACIQCSRCTDLCPRNLLGHDVKPHRVMRVANYGLSDFSGMKTALGCSECGICELYSCPNDLSPRRVNSMIKQELAKAGVKVDNDAKTYAASALISYRKVPVKRLIERLALKKYDIAAPLTELDCNVTKVVIPLKQHVGAPAAAVVKKGMNVEKGSLIAKIDDGKLGSNMHASISGVITDISNQTITIESIVG